VRVDHGRQPIIERLADLAQRTDDVHDRRRGAPSSAPARAGCSRMPNVQISGG
jgi:hypothetical protein